MTTRLFHLACLTAAATLAPTVVHAQGEHASSPAEFAHMADRLAPGRWVWAPQVAPAGPLLIYVDLSRQLATVYRNGVRIAVATISSGRPGFSTPTGVFTILQKDARHRSSKYNAAMPFTQRLTWDGVALHAGGLPGFAESHGCVHLPYVFARQLFGITRLGATVVVQGHAADHVRSTTQSLLAPTDLSGGPVAATDLQAEEYRWTPERSPQGPMTIVISKGDQAVVVLRNGVEIGRSVAQIDDNDPGSHVISLTSGPDGKPKWIYVGLPGHDAEEGRGLDEATLNKVHMPRGFYDAVKTQLKPGTTVLITQSSIGASASASRMTIMDAVVPRS